MRTMLFKILTWFIRLFIIFTPKPQPKPADKSYGSNRYGAGPF